MGKKARPRKKHHRPNPDPPKPHKKPRNRSRRKRHKLRDLTSPASSSGSGSDSDSPPPPSSPASVRRLLEPYAKDRLLSFLAEAAAGDAVLAARIRAAVDASPSHRKLFVYGLPPAADCAALFKAFAAFGPVADCNVVADRASGCCKGYGFVVFSTRAAALRALRVASVVVAGRPAHAQLASAGSSAASAGAERRVYVRNVALDACKERLRAFFSKFGELEGGPFGFDIVTGRSRGYALFVYRTVEGAKKALAEPHRVFDGTTLHCQPANDPAQKNKAAVVSPAMPAAPTPSAAVTAPLAAPLQPVLDAVAAAGAQNLALYAQNPAYTAALLGQNPLLAAAALNPALLAAAAALSPAAVAALSPAATTSLYPAAAALLQPATLASLRPAAAAVALPVASPVKAGDGQSGGAGLLGAYKPPSSTAASASASSSGKRGTVLGTSLDGFPGYP